VDRIAKSERFNGTEVLSDAAAGKSITFQVGIDQDPKNQLVLQLQSSTKAALGLDGSSVETVGGAQASIDAVDAAMAAVTKQRAVMGAFMNQADVAISTVQAERTSVAAASSRIRDVDVSEETAAMARNQVLSQAGASVLAQANQSPQLSLALLGR
jgi:flagellin